MTVLDSISNLFGSGEFFDDDFAKLLFRFLLNAVVGSAVMLGVYYKRAGNRDIVFTAYIFNVVTFCMCALLRKVPMDMGFALGLFAVFGILRYRTEAIQTRDLTYMFIMIAIAIINAVANKKVSFAELLLVNFIIWSFTWGLETYKSSRDGIATPMLYDNLALLRPGQEDALRADLAQRLGGTVERVHVHRIDLLRDAAEVTVYYRQPGKRGVTHA